MDTKFYVHTFVMQYFDTNIVFSVIYIYIYIYIYKIKDPKFARFYLPKIHKRLNNVPDRPVISNCGYYTENISAFLDFHLQPLAQAVKSYIKDTNDFLNKIRSLPKLPDNIILAR